MNHTTQLRVLPVVGTANKNWQIVNEHGGLIAHVYQKQHANVLAASYDLLEALEYLENVLSEQSEETFNRELLRIRTAIAKAV